MAKVIFFFAGTGDDCSYYSDEKERNSNFEKDVIRVYLKGCQAKQVGNGLIFPDLEIAAKNIRNAFNNKSLDLKLIRENFGDSLYSIRGNTDSPVEIDSIALEGFSRGAITTFAAAKRLDDLNIPLDIIANQPVPGETRLSKTLTKKYSDLTHCKNIRSATTILGTYNLENGLIHNLFFRQMLAKFPKTAQVDNFLAPHQAHLEWFNDSPIPYHINRRLAHFNYSQANNDEANIINWYRYHPNHYFTPPEFSQVVYGAVESIGKDPIYLKSLITRAHGRLKNVDNLQQTALLPNQAAAIVSVIDMSMDKLVTDNLIKLIVENSTRSLAFVKIINKVSDSYDYLRHVTADAVSEKHRFIALHGASYKTETFLATYHFLMLNQPTIEDKNKFATKLYETECKFRNKALGIERGSIRLILKFLTNFITHVTGIALIVNSIHKIKTGNWLFFEHNRSVNTVRNDRKEFLKELGLKCK
jgi:hypothetical protein